ncbi:strictosidine synthase [Maritimibacter sp. 55A14]|uniref:SMP-30/gluconolactonase/LRE family protein n=1 Tax=Maritimibacter sp. 55A14 TaxID=2174844 RepID=UPI000D60B3DB|nr:SMP-30/gluconolactonase/LRE family protein [Maritimibacter sp. 55A14]PWE28868.1 strictosidine synthase [Maritimibacter sp. 55A14]
MRRVLLLCLLAGLAYLLFAPVPMEPRPYRPDPAPDLTGVFVPNEALAGADLIALPGGAHGPEDLAVSADGTVWTTDAEGRLYRLRDGALEEVADLGGRPLGLEPHPDGGLVIADSYRGLLRWREGSGAELLAERIDETPILYANQLAVARDGTIYFSSSSQRFDPVTLGGTKPTSVMEIWEQGRSGFVARRSPDGKLEILLDGLSYANGLALSPGEDFLMVAETGRAAIHRLWLTGPKSGTAEPFMENLPGYPDNIQAQGDGTYWVGFASPRLGLAEALMPYPFLRKVIWRLGPWVRPAPARHAILARFDAGGRVLESFHDTGGATLSIVTGAQAVDGTLYVTSLEGAGLGRLPMESLR